MLISSEQNGLDDVEKRAEWHASQEQIRSGQKCFHPWNVDHYQQDAVPRSLDARLAIGGRAVLRAYANNGLGLTFFRSDRNP